ncbi:MULTISPECIES: glycosyltransferase family 2 protein [unclassified Cytobacillus]|uniref:glycosyltransferase family 2 protein n=1 Tax=unclassified Cytobacillus TaxID=2675268 RepID=UPI002040D91C|nr:glycosyltransferase family 2 protein [Cytobacillus sp. AMY 15.2]MCM3090638.1 glycosyltransferase family 2 protein [Cytobacillus sp. AMY 15.2]
MEQPLVSVVIPFYAEAGWLKEALSSVQGQTYKNIEVLVINDGSKEDISDIEEIYDINIRVINKENGGPASARNLGIEMSTGKYIAFLDSDDIWFSSKLSKQISYMETEGYVWSQHSYEMFWENSSKKKIIDSSIYTGDVYKDCFISFKVQTSCVVVQKKILIDNNIFFPLDMRYGQDVGFYKQIAKLYPLGSLPGIYSKFRIRGRNAGFRAEVQLKDRASTWKEIKKDTMIIKKLPNLVVLAYRITSILSRVCSVTKSKTIISEKNIEFISKLLYVFPYVLFKLSARKS